MVATPTSTIHSMMQGHFHLVAILLVLAVEPSASFSLPEDASADDPDLDVTLWSTVDLEHHNRRELGGKCDGGCEPESCNPNDNLSGTGGTLKTSSMGTVKLCKTSCDTG